MAAHPVPLPTSAPRRDSGSPLRAVLALGYRAAVGVAGAALVVTGLVLVPLPGPGWAIVFLGLAVLGREFAWADRLRTAAQSRVARGLRWSASAGWPVRAGLLAVTVVSLIGPLVALVAWR